MQNNVNSNISGYEGHTITRLGEEKKICTKYMASSEVMTSSTHSFAYSYRLVKKCFVKICENSKCHNFLTFQPIFIRFSLLCLKMFTLSSEIKLNLLWSSSLILNMMHPAQVPSMYVSPQPTARPFRSAIVQLARLF